MMRFASYIVLPLFLLTVTVSAYAFGKPHGEGFQHGVQIATSAGVTGKFNACQAHETNVKNRLESLVNLVNTMETAFDKIATRVENYYTTKVVPSGKTVPNYTALVATIQTQKTAVATALTTAQTDAQNFSCTESVSPKTQLTQFRLDMQAVKQALKNYRTAIKNLIVAVHTVTGSGKVSPTVTPTPKV